MADQSKDAKPQVGLLFDFQKAIIEVGDDRNRQIQFPPSKQILRGKWTIQGMGHAEGAQRGFGRMPPIPGMRVELDPKNKRARVFDPLGLSDMANVLAEANAVVKAAFSHEMRPQDESVFPSMSQDQLASWAYWMRRLVDDGKATMVEGVLPSQADCHKIGKVRRNYFDMGAEHMRQRAAAEEQAMANADQLVRTG